MDKSLFEVDGEIYMKKVPLTVVILTFNESVNIRKALDNCVEWAQDVFILDSKSTDDTVSVALTYNVKIFYRGFDNYSSQRNYAIKELPFKTDWVLFLDADEYCTEELKEEIRTLLLSEPEENGFYIKRRFIFMNKWIRYGGYYPTWILRLFRRNFAQIKRDVNEHVEVKGAVGKLRYDFIDENHKLVSDWIAKHNKYSDMEAALMLQSQAKKIPLRYLWSSQANRKMWIKEHIWKKLLPPLIRPIFYFLYRFFLLGGIFDGKVGWIYHFLQGLWLHFVIDVKYLELKQKGKSLQGNAGK